MGPEMIYAVMTIATSFILLIMVLLGGDADVDAGVDVGAEVGGPGYFGLKLLMGFIIGFGLGGFLAVHYAWALPHYLAGMAGGLIIYVLEFQLLKLLYSQQANTQSRASSVVGHTAIVSHPITKGGTGEIKTTIPRTGSSLYLRARAVDPKMEFADGTEVRVKSVSTGLARVEPVES